MATTTTPRTTRLVRVVALLAGLTLLLSACLTKEQKEVMDYVNQSRKSAGLPALKSHPEAREKAQAWAEHLAAKGSLSHSNLPSGITASWKSLGENVGYGPSIAAVHSGYMKSPGHKANILNAKFDYIGTGVAWSGNRVYTVHVFMQL